MNSFDQKKIIEQSITEVLTITTTAQIFPALTTVFLYGEDKSNNKARNNLMSKGKDKLKSKSKNIWFL